MFYRSVGSRPGPSWPEFRRCGSCGLLSPEGAAPAMAAPSGRAWRRQGRELPLALTGGRAGGALMSTFSWGRGVLGSGEAQVS